MEVVSCIGIRGNRIGSLFQTSFYFLYSYGYLQFKGEQKNATGPNVYDAGSTIEWMESMEICFVDLMIEQLNRGKRIGEFFNEYAWTQVTEAFNARLGLQCDKQFLLDQYFCLMKKHNDISKILSHSGFTWDETLQTVTAENDTWDAYIKVLFSIQFSLVFVCYHHSAVA